MGTFFAIVALWSHDVFGYDDTNVGVVFCSAAIPMACVCIVCTKRAIGVFGETSSIMAGVMFCPAMWIFVLIVEALWAPCVFVI